MSQAKSAKPAAASEAEENNEYPPVSNLRLLLLLIFAYCCCPVSFGSFIFCLTLSFLVLQIETFDLMNLKDPLLRGVYACQSLFYFCALVLLYHRSRFFSVMQMVLRSPVRFRRAAFVRSLTVETRLLKLSLALEKQQLSPSRSCKELILRTCIVKRLCWHPLVNLRSKFIRSLATLNFPSVATDHFVSRSFFLFPGFILLFLHCFASLLSVCSLW